jgi:hypothetical protein
MRSLAVAVCSKLLTWAMSPELLHRAALVGWGGHRWRSGRGKIAPAAHLEAGLRQQRGTEKGLSRSEYAKGRSVSITRRWRARSPSSCGGPNASSDKPRASARCTSCGSKGATLQHHIGANTQPAGQEVSRLFPR